MRHRLSMLNLATHADNTGLAASLNLISTDFEQQIGQELAQHRSMLLNFWAEVLDPAPAKPRVFDDRNSAHQFGWHRHGLTALLVGGLRPCQCAADFNTHGDIL